MKTRAIFVRILSALLVMLLVLGMIPVMSMAANTTTVYFDNTAKWAQVKIYYWGVSGAPSWPGVDMKPVTGTVYSAEIPAGVVNVIFNNGTGTQTADLTKPAANNLYTFSTKKWGNYTPPANLCSHTYTSKVTTAATCNKTGIKTFTCSKCGTTYTESIAATGHKYTNGKCTVCGVSETQVIYFKNTDKWAKVNAYCWNDGGNMSAWPGTAMKLVTGKTDIYSISIPGDMVNIIFNDGTAQTDNLTITTGKNMYIQGTGWDVYNANCTDHKWVQGAVVTAATCTKDGSAKFTCSVCNATKTDVVKATGHKLADGKCSVCGVALNFYVASSLNEWNAADTACKMTYASGKYTLKLAVPKGVTKFKVTDGTWDNAWPASDYLVNAAAACTITITYDPATNAVTATGYKEGAVKYYIHGWINENDYTGTDYQIVNGKVTVKFEKDSYVYIGTDIGTQYMAKSLIEKNSGELFLSNDSVFEKMKVPAGEITFTLKTNDDGSLTLSYHSYKVAVTNPTLTANGFTTYTCTICGYKYVANYTFPDVPNTLWSYKAVEFSVAKNYFTGYKSGNFGPTDNITRQDFVVVLARIAKVDLSKYAGRTSFPDVKAGDYYEAAVKWASSTGVVSGYKNGNFGVGDKITREQLVTILYRYAQKMGYDTKVSSNASAKLYKFGDAGKVTSYAKAAVIWALDKGIISGMTASTVGPLNNASRGQVATILMNISNKAIMPW